QWWSVEDLKDSGKLVERGFVYSSDKNPEWLAVDKIREMVAQVSERNEEDNSIRQTNLG
ncbi:MAG: hypothetical protein HY880_00960, partial [Deltaproteobacteria bacterium]|nr:hypothetical protein [Deltaproteobacteria bacterium]